MSASIASAGHGGHTKRRRFVPAVWFASVLAAALLIFGISGSLSGFSASITNSANTATTGTLLMTEAGISGVGGTGSCASPDGTCVLNKFGGQSDMVPDVTTLSSTAPTGIIPANGDPNQNIGTVKITNSGTASAGTLTLAGSACSTTPTTPDLCAKLDVAVYTSSSAPTSGTQSTYGTQVFYDNADTLATFNNSVASNVAAGASEYLTFVVWVDSSADNTYQGLTASEPLTWTFSQ